MNTLKAILCMLAMCLSAGCGSDAIEMPEGERIPESLRGEWSGGLSGSAESKPVLITSSAITARLGYSKGVMLFHVRGSGDADEFSFKAVYDDHMCEGSLSKTGEKAELSVTCTKSGLDGADQREESHRVTLRDRIPFS